MLLINTSVRQASNSSRVIAEVTDYFQHCGYTYDVAEMIDFPSFSGDYITDTAGLPAPAAALIDTIAAQQSHLYFVPTYYKSMPGVFKNFLDIVQMKSLYHHKRVGIVATNAKNQDYGARQFMQSLLGLLEFHKAVTVVVPQILILDPEGIDRQALQDYLDYYCAYPLPSDVSNDRSSSRSSGRP